MLGEKAGYRKVQVLLLMIHFREIFFLSVTVAVPMMVRIMSQIYISPILSGSDTGVRMKDEHG